MVCNYIYNNNPTNNIQYSLQKSRVKIILFAKWQAYKNTSTDKLINKDYMY